MLLTLTLTLALLDTTKLIVKGLSEPKRLRMSCGGGGNGGRGGSGGRVVVVWW